MHDCTTLMLDNTRPSVIYAKDWIDQSFLIPRLISSGKGYHPWMWSLWGSQLQACKLFIFRQSKGVVILLFTMTFYRGKLWDQGGCNSWIKNINDCGPKPEGKGSRRESVGDLTSSQVQHFTYKDVSSSHLYEGRQSSSRIQNLWGWPPIVPGQIFCPSVFVLFSQNIYMILKAL